MVDSPTEISYQGDSFYLSSFTATVADLSMIGSMRCVILQRAGIQDIRKPRIVRACMAFVAPPLRQRLLVDNKLAVQ
jgi:hypothetical protein